MQPIIGVGAVIWRAGSFVLIRRAKPPRAGEWSIPGGRLEFGESICDALKREVFEETGLEIELGHQIDVVELLPSSANGSHFVLVDFTAHWVRGELRAGSDAADARWAVLDELDRYGLWHETHRIIRKSAASIGLSV